MPTTRQLGSVLEARHSVARTDLSPVIIEPRAVKSAERIPR